MLKRLRWELSGLYVLAAAALIALIGGGAYGLLSYYFQSSNDLALQYKVALEYIKTGQPIPLDLQAVDLAWRSSRTLPTPTRPSSASYDDGDDEHERDEHLSRPSGEDYDEYYDSELASVFLLPIDSQGQIISNPNAYSLSFQPDTEAISAALTSGSDFRTVRQADGSRVRLFTYRVSVEDDLAVFQVGRSLNDQDRVLNQLLMGLLALGGLSVLIVGVGSWWLAGRSLIPAQRAWDRQQTFIANASHELRTPLTLLRASAEVARRGLDPGDANYSLLGDILSETDHMSQLVNDLLLLSRLDAGRLTLDFAPVEINEFLGGLAREMGRVADTGGIKFEVLNTHGTVLADETRLRQVLLVVLDNALRHTPEGGTIQLGANQDGRMIQIFVRDSGRGIPTQHLPHVFDRFYRGEKDRSQPSHGSGLGLSIAQSLVVAMQGQIDLASQPGKGTQVRIRLPSAD